MTIICVWKQQKTEVYFFKLFYTDFIVSGRNEAGNKREKVTVSVVMQQTLYKLSMVS